MRKDINPSAKRMAHFQEIVAFDRQFGGFGATLAGMDEAGRGPLFGPVVAACVLLPETPLFAWMDDSKKLSAARRETLYAQIAAHALYVGIGEADAGEIDRVNILGATKLAMERAAGGAPAALCLVDAVEGLRLPFATRSLVRGDAVSYHIAAASIVAKVTRDRMMAEYARQYPQYGLERNMGYGTPEHIRAIRAYGAIPGHRLTFVRKFLEEAQIGR